MNRDEIIVRLTPIAQNDFEKQDMILSDEQSSETVDTWTSFAFMRFLSDIEKEFGIKFKMMEVLSLKTIGDIVEAIAKH